MHCTSDDPLVMTQVFEPKVNMVVWQQEQQALAYVQEILELPWKLNLKVCLPLKGLGKELQDSLPDRAERETFVAQIAELSEMFACLFDLERVGLRIQVLDKPMCPRFHVDRVPCRLAATFAGPGTEWLTHEQVDRDFLGIRHPEEEELEGRLYQQGTQIQQLQAGEVGLLKGSLWEGNEERGLVHRSPGVPSGQKRLLLTLDLAS